MLNLESNKKLSFGGESYQVEVGENLITVDWIVRNDENAKFYVPALADALEIKSGVRVISPERLVILNTLPAGQRTNSI